MLLAPLIKHRKFSNGINCIYCKDTIITMSSEWTNSNGPNNGDATFTRPSSGLLDNNLDFELDGDEPEPTVMSSNKAVRARWLRDETASYMEHLATLTDQGHFDIDRPITWRPAFSSLLDKMNKVSPNKPWTLESMRMKRKSEKKRWDAYQTLINDYTSGDGVAASGGPILSDQQWARFLSENPVGKSFRETPFKNREIYARAFPNDRSTRAHTGAASEDGDVTLGTRPQNAGGSFAGLPPSQQAVASQTAGKRQRHQYDTDLVQETSDDPDTDSPPPRKRKAIGQKLSRQAVTNKRRNMGLIAAMKFRLACLDDIRELNRVPGSGDIEKAIKYCSEHIFPYVDDKDFASACDKLCIPCSAVVFNALREDFKWRYLKIKPIEGAP
ncbi:hypothetical protein F5B19DRAFT_470212 [Rostrohypoxylon terebratum]|nr:hypothetical protein F5B19DRAFT_470212 [Rostrohypoxylon terebratum]